MNRSPSRRESNDSDYSFSDYSSQFGDRRSVNSSLHLFSRDLERKTSALSSDGYHSRQSYSVDRRSSRLSVDFDTQNSSFSQYSDRRNSGYTSDCGDRRDSNQEERIYVTSQLVKPAIYVPFSEGNIDIKNPIISIEESDPQTPSCPKGGMKYVPDWLKSLRLHKYTNLIMNMSYIEMMDLTEEKLEKMNVTKGAARKIVNSLQKLKERSKLLHEMNIDIDNGTGDIKNMIADLESILKGPINIDDETEELMKTFSDGKVLIDQITVTLRKLCSVLLLSQNTDPRNGKMIFFKFYTLKNFFNFSSSLCWVA